MATTSTTPPYDLATSLSTHTDNGAAPNGARHGPQGTGRTSTTQRIWQRTSQDWTPDEAFRFLKDDPRRSRKLFWRQESTVVLLARIRPHKKRWNAVCHMTRLAGLDPVELTDFIDTYREDQAEELGITPADVQALEPQGDPHQGHLRIVETTGDATKPMPYLWWPYIPKVGLTFIDGDPGVGKTMLVLTLAAITSQGWPFPDQYGQLTLSGGDPAGTLYFSNENSLEYTIKPRLAQASANRDLVKHVQGIDYEGGKRGAFTLATDNLPMLEARLKEYQPALVIFDPIQSYIGTKVDLHRANETHPIFDALAELSERYECAMVGLRHPAKSGGDYGRLLYRGLGSIDLAGSARSVLFCERHPCQEDQVLLVHAKSNREYGGTQVFTVADGHFGWKGVSRVTASTFERVSGPAPRALMEAVFWVESVLTETPFPIQDLKDQAEEAGIAWKTVQQACHTLGVAFIPRRSDDGKAIESWDVHLKPWKRPLPPRQPSELGTTRVNKDKLGTTRESRCDINELDSDPSNTYSPLRISLVALVFLVLL